MSSTTQTLKGDVEFKGKKYKLEKKLENNAVSFYFESEDCKNFKGSLSLEETISQISLFKDYNIEEIF